jgi:hypothetical protein
MRENHAFCVKISLIRPSGENFNCEFIGVFADFCVGIGIAKEKSEIR